MPLPNLNEKPIPKAKVYPFELTEEGRAEPIKTWMRPLFGIERDLAEAAGKEFAKRFVTGGFVHPTTDEWKKEPDPIMVDDGGTPKQIFLSFEHAVMIHLISAMQMPPKGEDPLTPEYIVQMASGKEDAAWGRLQDAFNKVWAEGASGKAYAAASDTPTAN